MPELPEVETIVRDLSARLAGRIVEDVQIEWPGSVAAPGPADFALQLAGTRVEAVTRRGKYILISLSNGGTLLIHLRMTGRLVLADKDDPPLPYQRVVIRLDHSQQLRFADLRKFGRMKLVAPAELQELDQRLGLEPLNQEQASGFRELLRSHRTQIKSLLLDQRFLAGVGNIYADEALFQAGIHPQRLASTLSEIESQRLFVALRNVLQTAIDNRGTSFSDYLDARGQPGQHREHLLVYRRTHEPCLRCGTLIERLRLGGRGSHICPRCQPFA